ncbi:flagellar biosynthesis anti-sigma factor FlgM [Bacillus spongiae]|uniref:Negative regulator of flagellin synthesis n=1 Tax=Bacillus spongiae TaxID=2683610 RepID=A0ABU8HE06_9BACI
MKINPNRIHGVNPYQNQLNKVGKADLKQHREDKVEISSTALEMNAATKSSKDRDMKIMQLKNQVESGQYKLDARSIAESIIKYQKK